MNCIQSKQKWSWTTGNVAILSLAVYIATVFVFSANVELNIYSQVAFIVMCACSFLYILTEKRAFYVNGATLWLFGLLLLSFASLSWSMSVAYGIGKLITLVQLVVLCLFANVIIDSPYKVDFTINAVIFSGYFMYLYTFATVGLEGMLGMFNDDLRLGGQVNQENAFGYYSAIVFAFALYQMVYKKKRWYFLFLPLPIIMGLFSGSKKSLLLLALAAFMIIALKDKKKIISRTIFAVIVVGAAGYVLYRLGALDLVLKRTEEALSGTDVSTNDRQLFIEFGIEKIKEKPILGYGIEQFALLFEQSYGRLEPSHNNYVQILTSFGIVGFSLWYGAYLYFLVVGIKNFYKNGMGPMLVFIATITFVNDLTTTTLINKFTYILIALCFGMAAMINKQQKRGEDASNE